MVMKFLPHPFRSICVVASLLAFLVTGAQAATLEKVRRAKHGDFVRVVFDTSGPVEYTEIKALDHAVGFKILGIETVSQNIALQKSFAPLEAISLLPALDGSIEVVMKTDAKLRPRFYRYTPDFYGGHRLVVDLWSGVVTDDPHLAKSTNTHETPVQAASVPAHSEDAADAHLIAPEAETELASPIPADLPPSQNMALQAAWSSFNHGKYRETCATIEKNFPKGSWQLDAMLLHARCLVKLDKFAESEIIYDQVITLEPEHFEALSGLGSISEVAGEYRAAREHYLQALTPNRSPSETEFLLTRIQAMTRQVKRR